MTADDLDPVFDLELKEASEAERRKRDQQVQARWRMDVKWLMSGPRGRRMVFRILEETRAMLPVFDSNFGRMAHNEGRRDVGLYLLAAINESCPESYAVMLQEQREENERDDDGTRV